jgi:sugar O-acyltransferase (sialic acid O-acetyltransferase NeuD family)
VEYVVTKENVLSVISMVQSHTKELIILGAGGHGVSVCDLAIAAGFKVRAFIEPKPKGPTCLGVPVVEEFSDIHDFQNCAFAIAIGDNSRRESVAADLLRRLPDAECPTIIHPTAIISRFAKIGRGSIAMSGVHIGPQTVVGQFCLLNTRSSLDHDCNLADYASLGPGAIAGGDVGIGTRSAIGLGAVVRHSVTIGADVVVGAASYVHTSVARASVVYGCPAKHIRDRLPSDPYLS